ncbi:MAG: Ni/Fe hydrogenase subunit alpha [candidate division WOR-3 bacterium]
MSRRLTIDPVTRIEGHAKIDIFLDEQGNVENAYVQVPELRAFEQFCVGRRAEDMPQLTSRICGVCPVAHHLASVKALDMAFGVSPPHTARKLRELIYCGYIIYDHILHLYFLGGPDLLIGPTAPREDRNIVGVIKRLGSDVSQEVIKHRAYGQRITEILGGKPTHPVSGIPGGITKALTHEERMEIEAMLRSCLRFAELSLELFARILSSGDFAELLHDSQLSLPLYNMGLVDEHNRVNFYDGSVRITNQSGKELLRFAPSEYSTHIRERIVGWNNVKFPYLAEIGFAGLTDGSSSGLYRVGPLGRLNAADGMATPRANTAYQQFFSAFPTGRPVNSILAFHWARAIELLYATERGLELITDPEITSQEVRNLNFDFKNEGVGVVEAARGTLIHHYWLSDDRLITRVNLVVATTNNMGAINMSVLKAARRFIKEGKADEGILNMVEMILRAYDPCFGCASHLSGSMPFELNVWTHNGELVRKFAVPL